MEHLELLARDRIRERVQRQDRSGSEGRPPAQLPKRESQVLHECGDASKWNTMLSRRVPGQRTRAFEPICYRHGTR